MLGIKVCIHNAVPDDPEDVGISWMGLNYMGLNICKQIAKMSLELPGLLELLLLLLYVPYHVLLRGREAPP